jgi:hypothetical protein
LACSNNLINSYPNFESYFQLPFVDFSGPIDALKIFKKMELDFRLSNCFFNTFYTTNKETGVIRIRFCIMRPFVDINGQTNSGFSDEDFWQTICDICKEFE